MKPAHQSASGRRPVNLLLTNETVAAARLYTDNLSVTVDTLLGNFVAAQAAERESRRQRAEAVAEAWNACLPAAAWSDEFSTL